MLKSKRQKRRGRQSGGVLVYCKPNIRKGVSVVGHSDFSIWVKPEKTLLGLNNNKVLSFCYIKSYQSKENSELVFSNVDSDISEFSQLGDILLCGYFNARTGGVYDFIPQDSVRYSFVDCSVLAGYSPDEALPRQSLDSKSNLHGALLTDICKSCHVRIFNGRFLGVSLGYFSFFNNNGKNTVDYILASSLLLYCISDFNVQPPSAFSDHCLISTMIKTTDYCTVNTGEHSTESTNDSVSCRWSEDGKDKFIDSLLTNKSIMDMLNLNSLLDDPCCTDTDILVRRTHESCS